MKRTAVERWRSLPKRLRQVPIQNALFDANDDGIGVFGGSDERYPGEARERSQAFKLAAAVLREVARKPRGKKRKASRKRKAVRR